jgi:hypothetical protein
MLVNVLAEESSFPRPGFPDRRTRTAQSPSLFFGFLRGPEFFDGGADVGFPGERFVLGRVVGREVGRSSAGAVRWSGEFVAVHIQLAVGPGPPVGGQRVLFRCRGVAEGEPKLGEETMLGLAQLGQSLGHTLRLGELAEVVLGQGESGLGFRIGDSLIENFAG